MHPYVKDITRQTFGKLLVVGPAPRPEGKKGRGQYWECICECLQDVVVRSDSLLQGKSTSCGCTNPQTTAMRSSIGPRRTKSTVSEQPLQHCPKSTHNIVLNMTENQSTYSDTIGVKLDDLKAMRDTFTNLTRGNLLPATRACIAWLDKEIAKGDPKSSPANENDKPKQNHLTSTEQAEIDRDGIGAFIKRRTRQASERRTVNGETMSEQTERFIGIPVTPHAPGNLAQGEFLEERKGLRFKPALVNLSDRKHSHYFRKCPYDAVDIYRILTLFGITDQALGHAIKKLMVAGGRGAGKDIGQDVKEAIDTLQRWQEMREEDVTAGLAMLDLMKT